MNAVAPTVPAAERSLLLGTPWMSAPHDADPLHPWRQALAQGHSSAERMAAAAQGEFAVAISDSSGRALIAVDRFARQTLCYTVREGQLLFAQRADTLAGDDASIDPQALYDYVYLHAIASPQTVFKGVYRLPPGHIAWFDGGRLDVRPYWTPRFSEPKTASFSALSEQFRELLKQAVRRAIGSGPAACFLSGGTDSSTIAGMIGIVTDRPALTYSIGFDAAGYDEMAYARLAAKRFGTEHHEYYVTPDDLVQGIPRLAAHLDQPFGNSSALPAFCCAVRARDDGVSRLLAGDGGDELFGGNVRYAKQRVFQWYSMLPAALRRSLIEPVLSPAGVRSIPLLRKGASYVEQARVPMPDRMQMYNLLLRLGPAEVLSEALLQRIDPQAADRQQREVWAACETDSPVNRTLAFDWRYTLAENDLPKVRYATQLADVVAVYPFLDDDLLAFSLNLPTRYKLRGLQLRWFFKEALRGFLPDEILLKKKHGFGLPFGIWCTRHEPLRRLAEESVYSLAARGIVRPPFIDTLMKTHLPAFPGYYGEMVWILMMLEQWLRHHRPDYRLDA